MKYFPRTDSERYIPCQVRTVRIILNTNRIADPISGKYAGKISDEQVNFPKKGFTFYTLIFKGFNYFFGDLDNEIMRFSVIVWGRDGKD